MKTYFSGKRALPLKTKGKLKERYNFVSVNVQFSSWMLDVVQVAMEEAQRLNANVLYVDQDVQVSLLSSTKAFCSKLHNLNKFV
jgi:hypothetical protein